MSRAEAMKSARGRTFSILNVTSGLRLIVSQIMMFSILKYLFQSYSLAARVTWDKLSGIPAQNAPGAFCMFLNYQLH